MTPWSRHARRVDALERELASVHAALAALAARADVARDKAEAATIAVADMTDRVMATRGDLSQATALLEGLQDRVADLGETDMTQDNPLAGLRQELERISRQVDANAEEMTKIGAALWQRIEALRQER